MILHGYDFDGSGSAKKLDGDEAGRALKDDSLAWVHLWADHPDIKPWLEQSVDYLDPYIIEALLAEETRPRMTQIDDGILLILRGVNLNENAKPEDMVSIRMWVDPHRIISMRKRKLKAVADIEEKFTQGKGPKEAGEFVCMIVARLFARMQPVLSDLDERTDDIEEHLLEHADASLREAIVQVRKQAILFRRYMAPQRDAVAQLRMADLSWLSESNKRHLLESHNHITRYVEDLDAIRERAQIVKDEIATIQADKLNKNMYILSVIAAIFLPLGFLTGLLGINVGGMPGAEDASAFYIVSGLMVGIACLQACFFKWKKWF